MCICIGQYKDRKNYIRAYMREHDIEDLSLVDSDINSRFNCRFCDYSDFRDKCTFDRTITKADCIRGKKDHLFCYAPIVHRVKIKERYYNAMRNGEKTYEIRFNDRAYEVGDFLNFIVVNESGDVLNGRLQSLYKILSVDYYPDYIKIGYVIMSIVSTSFYYDIDDDMIRERL